MGKQVMTLIVPQLPHFANFYYARMGSFSLSTYSIRYIRHEDVISYENKEDTAGVHYRDFLKSQSVKFPRKNAPNRLSYPYYAKSASLPNAFYVDLRRAYQQIALSYGLDVWFKEGKSIGYGACTPSTQLFEVSKVARGLLVTGHFETSKFSEWKNGNLSMVKFPNEHYAPFLQYAIYRTLHAIMNKLKPFIYYAHTDGIICNARMIERVDKILRNEGFAYTIKHEGVARIKTTGCYSIGEHRSVNYGIGAHHSTDNIISDDNDNWWLRMFRQGLEKRQLLNDPAAPRERDQ